MRGSSARQLNDLPTQFNRKIGAPGRTKAITIILLKLFYDFSEYVTFTPLSPVSWGESEYQMAAPEKTGPWLAFGIWDRSFISPF